MKQRKLKWYVYLLGIANPESNMIERYKFAAFRLQNTHNINKITYDISKWRI
jgi:hypothetical protein